MIQKESRPYPKAVTVAFGRVFYGAFARVYFGQVMIDDFDGVGRCYQRNDPTAEDMSDVLDTDGGEILLQDAGQIKFLFPYKTGILVFCDNGIWYLAGSTEQGFTATSYTSNKISPHVLFAERTVVAVGEVVLFGGKESCYVVEASSGTPTVQSLTEFSIDSYWKSFIKDTTYAVHSDVDQKVFFGNTGSDTRILMFDTKLKGWYPWKVETGARMFEGAVYDSSFGKPRYFVSNGNSIQLAEQGSSLKDFAVNDYLSFILTQPETLGNYSKKKGTRLIKAMFKKTESVVTGFSGVNGYTFDKPSACKLSLRFDWDDNKVTPQRQVYRALPRNYVVQTGFPETLTTKNEVVEYEDKIRGVGKAVQARFESESNKEMNLLGYTIKYSME